MVHLLFSSRIPAQFIQRSFLQSTRTRRESCNQLAGKLSHCEYSKRVHYQAPEERYQMSCSNFVQELHKIFPSAELSPYRKAMRFLESSCSAVVCYQTQISPSSKFEPVVPLKHEIFSSAIIYDLLKDLPETSPVILPTLLNFILKHRRENGVFSYFVDGSFKLDVDTTSVCLLALLDGNRILARDAKSAAKILTLNTNTQGVVDVFFPSEQKLGGRLGVFDAGCLANMMVLLYRLEMETEAKASEDFIYDWTCTPHFASLRTKNYPPQGVLYFLSTLAKFPRMKERFQVVLAKHLLASIGTTSKALALAQRVLVSHNLGFLDGRAEGKDFGKLMGLGKYEELKREVRLLRRLQNGITGGWELPGNPFYHCTRFYYGSEAIVTAFAARALYLSQDICD